MDRGVHGCGSHFGFCIGTCLQFLKEVCGGGVVVVGGRGDAAKYRYFLNKDSRPQQSLFRTAGGYVHPLLGGNSRDAGAGG